MAIGNYGQLKSAVADWLNRDDLTAVIPTFIDLAHARLNRKLRVSDMIVRSTANLTAQYTARPNGFLEMRNIQLNVSVPKPLEYITPEQLDQERKFGNDTAGEPVYYTMIGDLIEVYPTPDNTTYEMELAWYKEMTAMSADSDTNWLLTKAPDAYLYGALINSGPYLKDDERALVWLQMHDAALEELRMEDERSRFGGGTIKARHRTFA